MLSLVSCGSEETSGTNTKKADTAGVSDSAKSGVEAADGYKSPLDSDTRSETYDGATAKDDSVKDIAEKEADFSSDSEMNGITFGDEDAMKDGYDDHVDTSSKLGMLTAGVWNDNDNWGFFNNIVNKQLVEFPAYGLNPLNRIEVVATDAEKALNQKVYLLDDSGNVIWQSQIGKNGKAYLFETEGRTGTKIKTDFGEIDVPKHDTADNSGQGIENNITNVSVNVDFNEAIDKKTKTQLMFIVDTTGSMSDELMYLQVDIGAIAEEVGDSGTSYSFNFYKDSADEYVTRCNDFTTNIPNVQSQLNAESANGGGDEPEAVAQVLDECINNHGWNDNAVKIAFLVFDAPPHDNEADIESIKKSISTAAEKGIHIVPVVSSNSNRGTELFGRALSIMTDGQYVFLTDDSGIGNSHLEPIIGDYTVESLHDILVRIIQDYKQ